MKRWWKNLRVAILGATETQELSASEVDALIDQYPATDVTNDLFSFGTILLAANDQRVAAIESKATSLVGYASAILAFLVTRAFDASQLSKAELSMLLLIGLAAGFGCGFAGLALKGTRNWKALSETTWFPRDQVLAGSDQLRRFWLKAMHETHQRNYRISGKKASQMILAQLFVALAGVLLAITLVMAAARAL